MEKNPDITKPRYSEQILSVLLALRYIDVPLQISSFGSVLYSDSKPNEEIN